MLFKKLNTSGMAECSSCSKSGVIFELARSLSKNDLQYFINFGYKQSEAFTKAGMFYVENDLFILVTSFGSNRLKVKYKKMASKDNLPNLEYLISNL